VLLALSAALLPTRSAAADPARSPAAAVAPARTQIAGTVTQVQGQRLKVKADNGAQTWYSTPAPLTQSHVGRRVRGESRPVGDTHFIDKPTFE
jgi:outer membrane lipoprotein SlyB